MPKITWYGHGCWSVETGEHTLLIDPFLESNPTAPQNAKSIAATHILVSHGHFDHMADVASIALNTGATLVACFEICEWFTKHHHLKSTEPMNIGGSIDLACGRVKMTPAWHSSALPDGSYAGTACGWLLFLPRHKLYFACDTALFGDMKLIGAVGLDLAVLPMGDRYTMGPGDAIEAVKLLQPRMAVPSHYNTWPPISQNATAWGERVRNETSSVAKIVSPGESFEL